MGGVSTNTYQTHSSPSVASLASAQQSSFDDSESASFQDCFQAADLFLDPSTNPNSSDVLQNMDTDGNDLLSAAAAAAAAVLPSFHDTYSPKFPQQRNVFQFKEEPGHGSANACSMRPTQANAQQAALLAATLRQKSRIPHSASPSPNPSPTQIRPNTTPELIQPFGSIRSSPFGAPVPYSPASVPGSNMSNFPSYPAAIMNKSSAPVPVAMPSSSSSSSSPSSGRFDLSASTSSSETAASLLVFAFIVSRFFPSAKLTCFSLFDRRPAATKRQLHDPAATDALSRRPNCALSAVTTPPVNITEFALARDAKDFSSGLFRKGPNTFVWPIATARSISGDAIAASFAASRNASQSEWSKR